MGKSIEFSSDSYSNGIAIFDVKIDIMEHADYNPQKMTREVVDEVKASIMEFGYVEPVVVNRRTEFNGWSKNDAGRLVIVGGHKRHVAVRELRSEGKYNNDKMPAVVKMLTPSQEKALNVALNKIRDEFDPVKLAAVMESIREVQPEMLKITGFKERELKGLVKETHEVEKNIRTAERFLNEGRGTEKEDWWLFCEPRNQKEFEKVRAILGDGESNELDMDKIIEHIHLATDVQIVIEGAKKNVRKKRRVQKDNS